MAEAPIGGGAPNFAIFVDYYYAKIIALRRAGGAPTDLQGGCPQLTTGGARNTWLVLPACEGVPTTSQL